MLSLKSIVGFTLSDDVERCLRKYNITTVNFDHKNKLWKHVTGWKKTAPKGELRIMVVRQNEGMREGT
jgi:hypothetical protein